MIYVAKDKERLDNVVFNHYKTLKYFDQVLAANSKLEPILKTGDKIVLPQIQIKENKENALW